MLLRISLQLLSLLSTLGASTHYTSLVSHARAATSHEAEDVERRFDHLVCIEAQAKVRQVHSVFLHALDGIYGFFELYPIRVEVV